MTNRQVVPCNGCRRCCIADAVRLMPHEDPRLYETEPHPYQPEERMLAHKANGECVYLDVNGCTIHERAPEQCRSMDCRVIAKMFSYTQARALDKRNVVRLPVWRKGTELLKRERGAAAIRATIKEPKS